MSGSLFPNEMKFKNGTYPFLGILRSHGIDLALAAAEARHTSPAACRNRNNSTDDATCRVRAKWPVPDSCAHRLRTSSSSRKARVAAFRDGQRGVGHDTAETAAHPAFGDEPLRKRKRPQPADVGHVPLRPVARETERLVGDFGIGSGLENIPEPGARIGSDGPVTALAEPSFEETVHLRKKSLPLHARIEPAVADIDRIAFWLPSTTKSLNGAK